MAIAILGGDAGTKHHQQLADGTNIPECKKPHPLTGDHTPKGAIPILTTKLRCCCDHEPRPQIEVTTPTVELES